MDWRYWLEDEDGVCWLCNPWGVSIVLIGIGAGLLLMAEPPEKYVGYGLIPAGLAVLIWAIAKNDPV